MERDSCLVCGNTKITCQYSILVCKSCFSFFHRSMKNKKVYVCRRNSKQCKIVASEKKCQYCRLKRCESIGMSVKKIKVANQRIESVSHDLLSQENKLQSMPDLTDMDNIFEEIPKLNKTTYKKIIFNLDSEIEQLKIILHGSLKAIPMFEYQNVSLLQSICFGINEHKKVIHHYSANDVIFTNLIHVRTFPLYLERSCLQLAKSLMYCSSFCQLAKKDRAILFNNFWPIYNTISRIYFALLIFGHDNNLVSVFFDERQCYDITKGMLYDPEMSEVEMKSIHQIAEPMNSVLYKSVYEPIKRLNLDEMEFSFMMVQSLFSTNDLEEISSDTLLIAENSLTLANNEIHGYFVVNKRLENYASRLTEIMKIISQIQKYNHCRSDVYLVSKVFEIIDADNLYELKMDLNSKQMIFLMN